jgi:hypothetical protein
LRSFVELAFYFCAHGAVHESTSGQERRFRRNDLMSVVAPIVIACARPLSLDAFNDDCTMRHIWRDL